MNSKQLIELVNEYKSNNWKNSDFENNSVEMFEKIAEHFEVCQECREEFDFQEFPEKTLIEFEQILGGTELSDWICDEEQ